MNEKKNKTQAVLAHLKEHGTITSLEAIIFNLRKRGYNIETVNLPFTDRFGTTSTFGKYILVE